MLEVAFEQQTILDKAQWSVERSDFPLYRIRAHDGQLEPGRTHLECCCCPLTLASFKLGHSLLVALEDLVPLVRRDCLEGWL